jgi:C-methyltransferase C-terminal domain/Putative zinc binding domain/Methyltransferase domain
VRRTSCRFCGTPLTHVFADLGMSPLANSYLSEEELGQMEPFYPLRALVCHECFLVQLEDYETPDVIFSEYAYFSSYSTTWLEHSKRYAEMATERFQLDEGSQVVELASNDGYLLQYFVERGIPVLGIEPAANVAEVARKKGIRTMVKFFGRATGREVAAMMNADLMIGNNVLAHVPELNDFVGGIKIALGPRGVITMEFPHLLHLIGRNEWDTIYHEHFSYFSFLTVSKVFERHGMTLFDVEELPTHGGSLRIYGRHTEDDSNPVTDRAHELAQRERDGGFDRLETYVGFSDGVRRAKWELLEFLIERRREGERIVAYGAPAKGNTLLNYCGVGTDFIEYTCDLNPHKQGHYLPGTRIPIRAPDAIRETRPDLVFILPWNLSEEIMEQLSFIREWGGRFVVRTPELRIYD